MAKLFFGGMVDWYKPNMPFFFFKKKPTMHDMNITRSTIRLP